MFLIRSPHLRDDEVNAASRAHGRIEQRGLAGRSPHQGSWRTAGAPVRPRPADSETHCGCPDAMAFVGSRAIVTASCGATSRVASPIHAFAWPPGYSIACCGSTARGWRSARAHADVTSNPTFAVQEGGAMCPQPPRHTCGRARPASSAAPRAVRPTWLRPHHQVSSCDHLAPGFAKLNTAPIGQPVPYCTHIRAGIR